MGVFDQMQQNLQEEQKKQQETLEQPRFEREEKLVVKQEQEPQRRQTHVEHSSFCPKPTKKRWLAVVLTVMFGGLGLLYLRSCLNRRTAIFAGIFMLLTALGIIFIDNNSPICELLFAMSFVSWVGSIIMAAKIKLK